VEVFNRNLENMSAIFGINSTVTACDAHPGSSATAGSMAGTILIQHHHAHALSVMAEHGLTAEAVAVVLDGTGYGTDGGLWGGEFLVANPYGFRRAGHFNYIALPGGAQAVREPRRMAIVCIAGAFGGEARQVLDALGFTERHGGRFIDAILQIIPIREFSPPSSSAGRLFDAVSSILALTDINTYEGQAPMELESIVSPGVGEAYPYGISDGAIVDFSATIRAVVSDVLEGAGKGRIAAMFHNTVAAAISDMAMRLSDTLGLRDVLLSGGVFQNAYLLTNTVRRLKAGGLNVYTNVKVPCNDGGISLGQAYGARLMAKGHFETK
jgi:hydrogenase maturation protein HypF